MFSSSLFYHSSSYLARHLQLHLESGSEDVTKTGWLNYRWEEKDAWYTIYNQYSGIISRLRETIHRIAVEVAHVFHLVVRWGIKYEIKFPRLLKVDLLVQVLTLLDWFGEVDICQVLKKPLKILKVQYNEKTMSHHYTYNNSSQSSDINFNEKCRKKNPLFHFTEAKSSCLHVHINMQRLQGLDPFRPDMQEVAQAI